MQSYKFFSLRYSHSTHGLPGAGVYKILISLPLHPEEHFDRSKTTPVKRSANKLDVVARAKALERSLKNFGFFLENGEDAFPGDTAEPIAKGTLFNTDCRTEAAKQGIEGVTERKKIKDLTYTARRLSDL